MRTVLRTALRALVIVGLVGGAAMAASKLYTKPGGFHCPSTNLMGAGAANALISCGGQNSTAIAIENESSTAVHFCGNNLGDAGITPANVTASCPKRCTTCAAGSVYAPEVETGQIYCVSSGGDAGVVVTVTCAK